MNEKIRVREMYMVCKHVDNAELVVCDARTQGHNRLFKKHGSTRSSVDTCIGIKSDIGIANLSALICTSRRSASGAL